MKLIVGSVVKGFALKSAVKEWLRQQGHEVLDVGCHDTTVFVKFPSIAERAAHALQQGAAPMAVLCCGSGTGMALAAGKFAGLCAVSAETPGSFWRYRPCSPRSVWTRWPYVNGPNCPT